MKPCIEKPCRTFLTALALCLMSALACRGPGALSPEEGIMESLKRKGVHFLYFDRDILQGGEPFWLAELKSVKIGDADIDLLAKIKGLANLAVEEASMTDADLGKLSKIEKLAVISLASSQITDAGIDKLADIKTLEEINISEMRQIDGTGLKRFSQLPNLKRLKLLDTPIPDTALRHLKGLEHLQELSLSVNTFQSRITDLGLKELVALRSLKRLSLGGSGITDVGLEVIAKLNTLEHLELNYTSIGNNGLKHCREMKNLKHLNLGGTRVDNDGLKYLQDHPSLTNLGLGNLNISDDGLRHLRKTRLENIFLNSERITDQGLRHLQEIKTLQYLNLYESKVTRAGIQQLEAALPGIAIVTQKR